MDHTAQGGLAGSQSQASEDQLLQRETMHTPTVGNLQSQLWLMLTHTCKISRANMAMPAVQQYIDAHTH